MSNKERLLAVRKLLHSEKQWTKSASARDKNGVRCPSKSVVATCWCLASALCFQGIDELFAILYFTERGTSNYVAEIIQFNDDPKTTHKDVLKALDTAIKLCKT